MFHGLFHGTFGFCRVIGPGIIGLGILFLSIIGLRRLVLVDRFLHVLGADRNERFAIGLRQWIGLLALRADQILVLHRFAGLNVLHFTLGSDGQILGDHRGVRRDLLAHGIRQLRIRIVRHAVRGLLLSHLHGGIPPVLGHRRMFNHGIPQRVCRCRNRSHQHGGGNHGRKLRAESW